MPRGENGTPITPDWVCHPRPCPFDADDELIVELAARVANDNGVRHALDDVIRAFGFTREELDADVCETTAPDESHIIRGTE